MMSKILTFFCLVALAVAQNRDVLLGGHRYEGMLGYGGYHGTFGGLGYGRQLDTFGGYGYGKDALFRKLIGNDYSTRGLSGDYVTTGTEDQVILKDLLRTDVLTGGLTRGINTLNPYTTTTFGGRFGYTPYTTYGRDVGFSPLSYKTMGLGSRFGMTYPGYFRGGLTDFYRNY